MSALHESFARASAGLWPALANHLWQATLFAALVLLLTLMLRGAAARTRFALWLVAALKFALPAAPLAFLAERAGAGSLLSAEAGTATGAPLFLKFAEPVAADASQTAAAVSGAPAHTELFCALTLLWLAGSLALVAVWLVRRREFLRSVREGEEVWSGREFDALGRARARLGLKDEVLLSLSAERTEPGVWRARRPVVVLPAQVAPELDDEELEAVLLHELAHVERRDNFFGYLQTALQCVFWFNPAVWLVGRRLLAERERACDERVLEAGGEAGAYAAGILKVVRFCSGWRVAGVSGAASGSNLRRRIEMIMRGERGAGSRRLHRAAVCGLAAAALALTAFAGLAGRAPAAEARMLEGGVEPQAVRSARGRVVQRGEPGPAVREVEQAAESMVFFEHAAGAPVAITEARMRQITREQLRRANDEGADADDEDEASQFFLTLPTVTLANVSNKPVREVGVGYSTGGHVNVVSGYAVRMNPGESQTLRSD
ncbi:MAG TPA: M56 family metallopeptidase, partial [Pyrinomonadaceae bacterium]